MSASTQQTQIKLSNQEEFDDADHALALDFILGFLWCHQKNLLMHISCGITNDLEIIFLAETLHSTEFLPKRTIAPAISECFANSNHTLAPIGTILPNLSDALLKSTDSKKEKNTNSNV